MEPKIKKPKGKIPKVKSIAGSIKKKNGILFMYIVVTGVITLCSSFLFAKQAPSMGSFVMFQLWILVLGVVHCLLLFHLLKIQQFSSISAIVITFITMLFSAILSLLNAKIPLFFNYPSYYTWGIIIFLLPWSIILGFEYLESIPKKIYSSWIYPYGKEVPIIEVIEPKKLKFYISLQHSDEEYNEFSLNVPMKYKVGEFLHYFIHRYNYDKNPQEPIFVSPDNSNLNMYGWLFTTKGSMGKLNVLDPHKSFAEQGVKENSAVLIDRYFSMTETNYNVQEEDILETDNQQEHAK